MRMQGKIAGTVFLSLAFGSLVPVAGWAATISEVRDFVQSLPKSHFIEGERDLKTAVQRELNAISKTLELVASEEDEEAKTLLNEDVIANLSLIQDKTDGCVISGTPDVDDWLENCKSQESFHSQLGELIAIIETP